MAQLPKLARLTEYIFWRLIPARRLLGQIQCPTFPLEDDGSTDLPVDQPIEDADWDLLERARLASAFANNLLEADSLSGLVAGLLGPWGAGKTSFINLARPVFEERDVLVFDFNPWLFSGSRELISVFFREFASFLADKDPWWKRAGREFASYGDALSALGAIPVIGWGFKAVGGVAKQARKKIDDTESITAMRTRITSLLREASGQIIVILDDVDRLDPEEIRDVFKLVRLTGRFPNITYLISFDRDQVEKALSTDGADGREYLAKILQITYNLPVVSSELLHDVLWNGIEAASPRTSKHFEFDDGRWHGVYFYIIRPLVHNVRDVRRYQMTLHNIPPQLYEEVSSVDIRALEAIRLFLPDAYMQLDKLSIALTTTSPIAGGMKQDDENLKRRIQAWMDEHDGNKQIIVEIIERLFPAATRHLRNWNHHDKWLDQWLGEGRVAHPMILGFYLSGVAGSQFETFRAARRVWGVIEDPTQVTAILRSFESEKQVEVLQGLEMYESQYAEREISPTVASLVNLAADMSVGLSYSRFGDVNGKLSLKRVVYRMLRSFGSPESVDRAVAKILRETESLSGKQMIIDIIGYTKDVGHRLATQEYAENLKREIMEETLEHYVGNWDVSREWDLLQLLLRILRTDGLDLPPVEERRTDEEFLLALLRSAWTPHRVHSTLSVTTRVLPWEILVEIVGSEAGIRDQIGRIKVAELPEEDQDLIDLSSRYLDGWRPNTALE